VFGKINVSLKLSLFPISANGITENIKL